MKNIDCFVGMILMSLMTTIGGYAWGTADHYGKEAVIEQFQSWDEQAQQDFIIAAVKDKHGIRRAVAEDWCAINRNTQRVCWNARMRNPIK